LKEKYYYSVIFFIDLLFLFRKFKGSPNERTMVKFSYLGGDLSSGMLSKLVKAHNEKHPPEFHIKTKGVANIELPPALMASFF